MKTRILTVVLFAIFGMYTVNGQIDIMKALEDAAKEIDEHDAERDAQNGRTSSNNRNNNNDPSGDQLEYLETWKQILEQQMLELKEGMSYFDTKETACIFTMVIYLDSYFKLLDEIEATSECEVKSGLLTMQSMAIGSSTLIMYCPESIYNMTDEELYVVQNDISNILNNYHDDPFVVKWLIKAMRVQQRTRANNSGIPNEFRQYSWYFSPQYILPELINVQQRIEALGCGS